MRQDYVEVRIQGPELGDNVRIRELHGREAISHLFEFELDVVVVGDEGFDAAAVLGSDVTLLFVQDGEEVRTVHGMVAELDDKLDTEAQLGRYRMLVMPHAFRSTLVETQEVFMDLSVADVVEEKLKLVGLEQAFERRLSATYPTMEFVTQYKESDLAFMSRLTEHVGISFFFEHTDGDDRLILTDEMGGFAAHPDDSVPFLHRGEHRGVFELEARHRLTPGAYVVQDYNYRKPLIDLTATEPIEGGFAGGVVEYGGHFKTPDEATFLARVRAEERRAGQLVYVGRTELGTFSAGARVNIAGHPTLGDVEVLLVSVEHHVKQVVGASSDSAERFTSTFRAIPRDRAYRPPRVTPRPRIYGIVSGIVDPAGTKGSRYARIDEDGRYVIRLLYDTADASGRLASRPVRMAQPHTGPDYGMHFPLKPGVEVLLSFIDGDPDRPIIVGSVPNAVNPSPVDARDSTLNRLKSASGIVIEYGDRRT
jgi:type VI secretion system secreted protein VgrG